MERQPSSPPLLLCWGSLAPGEPWGPSDAAGSGKGSVTAVPGRLFPFPRPPSEWREEVQERGPVCGRQAGWGLCCRHCPRALCVRQHLCSAGLPTAPLLRADAEAAGLAQSHAPVGTQNRDSNPGLAGCPKLVSSPSAGRGSEGGALCPHLG